MDFSTVVLAIPPYLADHLYTAWQRRRGRTDQHASGFKELIARDHQNQLLRRKLEREIETLAEHIVESLEPIFALDGAVLSHNDLELVIVCLSDLLKSTGVSPKFLLERKLDPLLVARAYRKALPPTSPDLSEEQTSFFNAFIDEVARRLIALADHLSGFGQGLATELLRGHTLILDQGNSILRAIAEFSEANKAENTYLLNNFDLRFNSAVRHRFGQVQILGLDSDIASTRLSLNTSYISLRADASVSTSESATQTEVSCDALLHRSKRVLIRGHAGSGKTTLLQWLAIQCADKAFLPPVHVFNGHAPLIVRLRDYNTKPLPTGHDLLSTTSSAMADLDPGQWFRDRLHRGRFLFLIDGIDEISEDRRADLYNWIEDLIVASPHSSYFVTTRPSAVEGGYLRRLEFDEYFLKPMTPAEVRLFVEYWHDAMEGALSFDRDRRALIAGKKHQLISHLDGNNTLTRLASSPLLCAVACTLNLDGKLALISDRVDLYATASRLLYHDRDKKNDVFDPIYDTLSRKQKERLLSYIAYQFIKNDMNSCGIDLLVSMILRSTNQEQSAEATEQARALADGLLVRSGILSDVSPDTIQFLHKTFQEYLGALEVVYRQDERHVAKHLDLRSWGELYLIALAIAPREVASEMVNIVFERARVKEDDWLAYLLLAGAGCREVPEINSALKDAISLEVRDLIPPSDMALVYQMAEMGSMVLPFLDWREEYGREEIDRILTLLGLVDDDEAKSVIEKYAISAAISVETVDLFMRALDYKNDQDFTARVLDI